MPQLTRLSTLILNSNKIDKISKDAMRNLPNLRLLVLNSNSISNLEEVEKLSVLGNLEHLSLIGNPVTDAENYRLFVIFHLPWVRILDLSRVKLRERQEAKKIFGKDASKAKKLSKAEGGTAGTKRKLQDTAAGTVGTEEVPSKKKTKLSEKEIFEAIQKAKTKDELEKLEKLLALTTKTNN